VLKGRAIPVADISWELIDLTEEERLLNAEIEVIG